jgi:hypothetical protein
MWVIVFGYFAVLVPVSRMVLGETVFAVEIG